MSRKQDFFLCLRTGREPELRRAYFEAVARAEADGLPPVQAQDRALEEVYQIGFAERRAMTAQITRAYESANRDANDILDRALRADGALKEARADLTRETARADEAEATLERLHAACGAPAEKLREIFVGAYNMAVAGMDRSHPDRCLIAGRTAAIDAVVAAFVETKAEADKLRAAARPLADAARSVFITCTSQGPGALLGDQMSALGSAAYAVVELLPETKEEKVWRESWEGLDNLTAPKKEGDPK